MAITIKKDDTEPLEFTVNASGVDNLDDVNTVEVYARKVGSDANHVDGASGSVSDSANQKVEFDPVGNAADGGDAFDEVGAYEVYLKVTWSDGDFTRHPGSGFNTVNVTRNFE